MNRAWLLLPASLVSLAIGLAVAWSTALIFILLLGISLLGTLIWRKSYLMVPELQVAVIFNAEQQAFSRFLPAGRHFLMPWIERVQSYISASPQAALGTCEASTRDGHTIQLDWKVLYRLDPLEIDAANCINMARTLPQRSAGMVETHTCDCLREMIESYPIDALLSAGIQKRIKRQLKHLVAERLEGFGFTVFRIVFSDLKLPVEVTENLQLQHLLNIVMQTTGNLDPLAMERLNQLRPVLVSGKNSKTSLVYGIIEGNEENSPRNPKNNGRAREKLFTLPLAQ